MERRLFTSESVTEGHPDKMCDAISDAILDALMEQDPMSRVACETATTTGLVMVMGEITTKAYVDIQKIRFNDKFSYTVDLQEGLEECVIPKLIIQPIVENSVLHGLKESEEGNILVRITGQEDVLCIEVTDDGCGAPEERIDAINHRRQEQLVGHIGVSNVDTIIRLTYGEEYGIHMESLTSHAENPMDGQRTEEEGEVHGTKVTLRLPVRYGEA